MNNRRGSIWVFITLSLLLGLAIGLLIGWVIWPVEWINASPENLSAGFQTDFVNMAVDSFSVNNNEALAFQRYSFLGASGPQALGSVIENPVWVTPAQVDAYTQAILNQGGEQALGIQPEESALPKVLQPPVVYYLAAIILLGLLAIVLLSTALVRALRPREVPAEAVEPAAEAVPVGEAAESSPEVAVEEVPEQETVDTRLETVEAAPEEDTQPVQVAAVTAAVEAEQATEPEERGVGIAGAAAALGAAALAGAAIAGSDQEESAEEPVTAATEEVVEAAVPESEMGGSPGLGAAAVAAAVGLSAAGDRDEEISGDDAGAAAALSGVEWALEQEAPAAEVVAADGAAGEVVAEEWVQEVGLEPEQASDYFGKYNRKLIDVEGIGPAYSAKLAEAGLTTTQAYLQTCATPKGRQQLAESTGITGKLILEWANHIDLMRIQGIGPQWSDLLEAAGIDTVRELASRNPLNLFNRINEINTEKSLVRQLPTQTQIEDWIEQAKELPRILNY